MSTQPGWHPDPSPAPVGAPPQLRYWDGGRWTEHTAPYPQTYVQRPPYAVPGRQSTTPDGVPLAGWWQRAGASFVDGLIQLPILAILWIPFYGRIGQVFGDYLDEVDEASRTGAPTPSATDLQVDLALTISLMTLVSLVFGLLWTFAWLRAKQATPGKLALGLRIRQRDDPGPLPWGVIARRWAAQYGVGLLGLIPFVGSLAGIYSLLDVLWASWDDRRQCLHDKLAGTNVVRVR